jgi:hypothetical protein
MCLRRYLRKLVALALCLSIIGCVLLALSGGGYEEKDEQVGGGQASGMWNSLARKAQTSPPQAHGRLMQARKFPIMRTAPEKMPSRMDAHIRSSMGSPPRSFDLENAQLVGTADGDIWIVNGQNAGTGITCLVQANGGAVACTTASDFISHGLALGTADPAKQDGGRPEVFHLLGVVPKWVSAVQVRIGGRRIRRIPVSENSYAMRADAPLFIEHFLKHGG